MHDATSIASTFDWIKIKSRTMVLSSHACNTVSVIFREYFLQKGKAARVSRPHERRAGRVSQKATVAHGQQLRSFPRGETVVAAIRKLDVQPKRRGPKVVRPIAPQVLAVRLREATYFWKVVALMEASFASTLELLVCHPAPATSRCIKPHEDILECAGGLRPSRVCCSIAWVQRTGLKVVRLSRTWIV